MKEQFGKAREFLRGFKGESYVFGLDCFERLGEGVAALGRKASVVAGGFGKEWGEAIHERTLNSLASAGVALAGEMIRGARPNSPREDVERIRESLVAQGPDVVVAVGGGSVIDATKAAVALAVMGDEHPDVDEYFGVGQVTAILGAAGREMIPMVCVQLASGSAAHLTKYANVTEVETHQKKLIVDDAIVPERALFDYAVTTTMSPDFTADGALDGVAHALEVLFGAKGDTLEKVRPVATLAIELIVGSLKTACGNPEDLAVREALGLGTDLGGYCIMIGGTNGGHLTSFSLVDVLAHGRACAIMNPYYTVFFAPAIEDQLRTVADVFADAGYLRTDTSSLSGRDLGLALAEAMLALSRDVGFPTKLSDVEGFSDAHVERALEAAKNPQLEMKLRNMPVPLSAGLVDDYMGPVLEAAKTGDFSLIRTMKRRSDSP